MNFQREKKDEWQEGGVLKKEGFIEKIAINQKNYNKI